MGVAFGMLSSQEEIEAFIAAQGENIEVKRTLAGFPKEIILKNEIAEEALMVLGSSHGDTMPLPEEEYPTPPDRTPDERRACFEKYSRPASAEERALVAEWDVKDLRIVDFNSIVEGLDDEAQKAEALCLIKKENEKALLGAIDRWVDKCRVRSTHWLKIFFPNDEADGCAFPYTLAPKVIQDFRESFKIVLKSMLGYRSVREMFALALVLLKDGMLSVDCCFDVVKMENARVASICYDLVDRLYGYLGIEEHYSLVGDLDSTLERDLFRLGKLPVGTESVQIPLNLFHALFRENYYGNVTDCIEIPEQKFYRVGQMCLLWMRLNEIWYNIGFANVGDCVYVNRMSGMNLLKMPILFHTRQFRFVDRGFLGPCFLVMGLERYPFVANFLKDMELMVTKDLSTLCPTPEAWKVWLQLQDRKDTDVGYCTAIDKTRDEMMTWGSSIELLDDK